MSTAPRDARVLRLDHHDTEDSRANLLEGGEARWACGRRVRPVATSSSTPSTRAAMALHRRYRRPAARRSAQHRLAPATPRAGRRSHWRRASPPGSCRAHPPGAAKIGTPVSTSGSSTLWSSSGPRIAVAIPSVALAWAEERAQTAAFAAPRRSASNDNDALPGHRAGNAEVADDRRVIADRAAIRQQVDGPPGDRHRRARSGDWSAVLDTPQRSGRSAPRASPAGPESPGLRHRSPLTPHASHSPVRRSAKARRTRRGTREVRLSFSSFLRVLRAFRSIRLPYLFAWRGMEAMTGRFR